MTGRTWTSSIIQIIYNFTLNVWLERNKDRHGRDRTERERLLVERALIQTKEFYRIRDDVLPRHRKLFYESFEKHVEIEQTSWGLQQWIHAWGPVLNHSVAKAKRLGITGIHSITQYLSNDS